MPFSDIPSFAKVVASELSPIQSASGCNGVSERARLLVKSSLSANSQRAYQSDLTVLRDWLGELPWSPEAIANYLGERSQHLKLATLLRHLVTAGKAHRYAGLSDPTKTDLVRATLRGIRRVNGTAQRQAKPLLLEDLALICGRLGSTLREVRDRALLLLGFAGAFRRSELVGLDVADLEEVRQGIVVNLRSSKTDQFGAGRKVAIPFGRTQLCPVNALKQWRVSGRIDTGPLFRPFETSLKAASARLSAEGVSLIVKARCAAVGFDPADYSAHSLRAGLATSAAMAGASSWKIRAQTGHASDAMLARYVRDGELWIGNAAGTVL